MAQPFPLLSRILHWTMAVLILAMLFIGIAMIASLSDYHRLVAIHRPLGLAILVLVAIRLVNRLIHQPPPLPPGMPRLLRIPAHASHYLLYFLMFALPVVGWGMLSTASYPIVVIGALHLPPILPHSDALYAIMRPLHSVLAFLLFGIILAHLAAALMHALIFRDGVFESMVTGAPPAEKPEVISAPRREAPAETIEPTELSDREHPSD
jgi:cytochrome b561